MPGEFTVSPDSQPAHPFDETVARVQETLRALGVDPADFVLMDPILTEARVHDTFGDTFLPSGGLAVIVVRRDLGAQHAPGHLADGPEAKLYYYSIALFIGFPNGLHAPAVVRSLDALPLG